MLTLSSGNAGSTVDAYLLLITVVLQVGGVIAAVQFTKKDPLTVSRVITVIAVITIVQFVIATLSTKFMRPAATTTPVTNIWDIFFDILMAQTLSILFVTPLALMFGGWASWKQHPTQHLGALMVPVLAVVGYYVAIFLGVVVQGKT